MESKNKNHPITDNDKILLSVFIVSFLIGTMIDMRFGILNFFWFSILLKIIGCASLGLMVYKRNKRYHIIT